MTIHGQTTRTAAVDPQDLPGSLAFLARHGIGREVLRRAADIASRCGVEPDEALLRSGLADEDTVYRALAQETGLPFEDGELPIHPMARFPESILTGIVPLSRGDTVTYAYAPQGERFSELVLRHKRLTPGLAIVTPTALRRHVIAARGKIIAARAADGLARRIPEHSARYGMSGRQVVALVTAAFLLGISLGLWPALTWLALTTVLGLMFLGVTTLRLASVGERIPTEPARGLPPAREEDLPVYTVLVPLFREVRVLPRLLAALDALDYPRAKLDIKLIIEEEDSEMHAALARTRLPGNVEVIVAPDGAPRTKPRALNVALPLARGEFVTIYDAEDVPEPNQLRLAVDTFRRSPPDVACLQARLVIDNTADSWVTRLFTLEYAALFDVLNPALARFDLPLPLGGTSNHIKTSVIQGLGGWDAWNVTEDADLGIRLAIAGYRTADLQSATLEEAPRRLRVWVRQRRRWMKGYLQVSVTHSRRPLRLLKQIGGVKLYGAAALSLGSVGSALGFPFFLALAIADLCSGDMLRASTLSEVACASVGVTLFVTGLLAMFVPPLEALRRRRWWRLMPLTILMPGYYLLISWAAWRGLFDLILEPHHWLKTEHGFARTSRKGTVPTGDLGECADATAV